MGLLWPSSLQSGLLCGLWVSQESGAGGWVAGL